MEQATLATEFFFGRKAPIFALQKPVKLAVLFTQIFIDACGCLAAFAHGYLSLPRQNPSFAFAKLARQGNFFSLLTQVLVN